MRDGLRGTLNTEVTRKQFLQYLAGVLLMIFGLDNLISLLKNDLRHAKYLPNSNTSSSNGTSSFGSRKFGE
jgi:hypothetical protein